jgi:hypothetical protein
MPGLGVETDRQSAETRDRDRGQRRLDARPQIAVFIFFSSSSESGIDHQPAFMLATRANRAFAGMLGRS